MFSAVSNFVFSRPSLYIRILIWAYNKREKGFIWRELYEDFNLDDEKKLWVQKIFYSNMPVADNLVDYIGQAGYKNENNLVMTAKGISAAVDYLNLKQAEKSGKRAEKIAVTAIVIGVIVGLAQIIATIF